jgi:choline dehydrogenase
LYVRGHRHDYDTWKLLGNDGRGYDDVLPIFTKSEDNSRGASEFHGAGGPLGVSDPPTVHPLLDAWIDAAQEAGHKPNDDFNGAEQEGVGRHQMTQRHGLRCSSADAFLGDNLGRPNLTLLTSTLALRLLFNGDGATGLEVDHLGEVRTIGVDREIILSLGAYNSPHLLMQSGVGHADELTAAGITPLFNLPDVGRHLQDHAGCFMSFYSAVPPLLGPDTSREEAQLRRDGTGPMAWTEVGGFLNSSDDLPAPDLQFHATLESSATKGCLHRPNRDWRSARTSPGPRAAVRSCFAIPTRTPSHASCTTIWPSRTTACAYAPASASACRSPAKLR